MSRIIESRERADIIADIITGIILGYARSSAFCSHLIGLLLHLVKAWRNVTMDLSDVSETYNFPHVPANNRYSLTILSFTDYKSSLALGMCDLGNPTPFIQGEIFDSTAHPPTAPPLLRRMYKRFLIGMIEWWRPYDISYTSHATQSWHRDKYILPVQ